MAQYRCVNCGYGGDELIYQFSDYTYCVASNDKEPDFVNDCPTWVKEQGLGEAEIGQPVGCPECRTWGVNTFEEIE